MIVVVGVVVVIVMVMMLSVRQSMSRLSWVCMLPGSWCEREGCFYVVCIDAFLIISYVCS